MIWITILLIIVRFLSGGTHKPINLPNMKDITSQLYLALSNDTKVYKLSSVSDMMNDTRRNVVFNLDFISHGSTMMDRSLLCYTISLTYRSSKWDMDRYFHVRDLYVNNLEYEIGYLTQEVIHHYQVILEIYQMVDKRYIQNPERNFAPVNYVFFLYANILEKSKIIIHLCNMMHELENKYKKVKSAGVFAEYDDPKSKYTPRKNMTEVELESIKYQKWLAQKQREEKKRAKEHREYQKKFKKFGMTTSKKRSAKKKGSWPINYGWSIENW